MPTEVLDVTVGDDVTNDLTRVRRHDSARRSDPDDENNEDMSAMRSDEPEGFSKQVLQKGDLVEIR